MERLKDSDTEWGLTRGEFARREAERKRIFMRERRLKIVEAMRAERALKKLPPIPASRLKIHESRSEAGLELGLRYVELDRPDGLVSLPYVAGYFPAA